MQASENVHRVEVRRPFCQYRERAGGRISAFYGVFLMVFEGVLKTEKMSDFGNERFASTRGPFGQSGLAKRPQITPRLWIFSGWPESARKEAACAISGGTTFISLFSGVPGNSVQKLTQN